jgi:hypothetical protein
MSAEVTLEQRQALASGLVRVSEYVTIDDTLRIYYSVPVNHAFNGDYVDYLWVLGNDGWGSDDWHLVREHRGGRLEIQQCEEKGWGSSAHALRSGLNHVLDDHS